MASIKMLEAKAQFWRVIDHTPVLKDKLKNNSYGETPILPTAEGRKILIEKIESGKPFMAARFGTTEGAALYSYIKCKEKNDLKNYPVDRLKLMFSNAGFFPENTELLFEWCEDEMKAGKSLDILGVMGFLGEEYIYRTYCNNAVLMPNGGLASGATGWAHCLEGKKVLVIHPFTDTIISQYKNHRTEIFPGTNALPEFDLKTVKAVQTISDAEDSRFADWFEALDYMTEEAAKQDFDVALIGCGAYGFQLAANIKAMGKQAVHMGGSLQTLFGIRGSRWDVKYSAMYNDSWVYPSEAETPKGFEKIEGGCYWK